MCLVNEAEKRTNRVCTTTDRIVRCGQIMRMEAAKRSIKLRTNKLRNIVRLDLRKIKEVKEVVNICAIRE